MAGLLTLPNEFLNRLLEESQTTQILLTFVSVNHRLHAIWMTHSDMIIATIYGSNTPLFKQAVGFTLAGARTAACMTTETDAPEAHPQLHVLLPQILQNVELAIKTCNQFTEFRTSLPVDHNWHRQPFTSLHDAYFVIRRAALRYSLPELRPELRSELRSLPPSELKTSQRLVSYITNLAPCTLRSELGCVLTEDEMEHVPLDDQMTRPPLSWSHAQILLSLAILEREEDATRLL